MLRVHLVCRSRKLRLAPHSATERTQLKRYSSKTYARLGLGRVIEIRNSDPQGREVEPAMNR
jgi:hypothetical protein